MRISGEKSESSRSIQGYATLCAVLFVATAFAVTLAVSAEQPLSFDHAATDKKIVALTFDADMTPGMLNELRSKRVTSWYNEKVIAALRQEKVPATLFMTGLWIEAGNNKYEDGRGDGEEDQVDIECLLPCH